MYDYISVVYLTLEFRALNDTLQRIADGHEVTFNQAMDMVEFYQMFKDTGKYSGIVERTEPSQYATLLNEALGFEAETRKTIRLYQSGRRKFDDFHFNEILFKRLEPLSKRKIESMLRLEQLRKDYKRAIDGNSLSSSEIEKIRIDLKECEQQAVYAAHEHSKQMLKMFPMARTQVTSIIMWAYKLNEMTVALIKDLNNILGKEEEA